MKAFEDRKKKRKRNCADRSDKMGEGTLQSESTKVPHLSAKAPCGVQDLSTKGNQRMLGMKIVFGEDESVDSTDSRLAKIEVSDVVLCPSRVWSLVN